MGFGRTPKSDKEIIREAEAEAQEWAKWLKPHVAKGINWVIEQRTGQVASRNRKGVGCTVHATSRYVAVRFTSRVAQQVVVTHLKKHGFKIDSVQGSSIFVMPHK